MPPFNVASPKISNPKISASNAASLLSLLNMAQRSSARLDYRDGNGLNQIGHDVVGGMRERP